MEELEFLEDQFVIISYNNNSEHILRVRKMLFLNEPPNLFEPVRREFEELTRLKSENACWMSDRLRARLGIECDQVIVLISS